MWVTQSSHVCSNTKVFEKLVLGLTDFSFSFSLIHNLLNENQAFN